jgi:long-chain acyl-CoA synthetase
MLKNLGELLRTSARRHPQHMAIVFGQKKITYKKLDELTDHAAIGLIDLGIKKGDKVAILLDNCPEFVISYYGILKAGAVVVPINYMFKIEEAKYILEDSQAKAMITLSRFLPIAEELRLRVESLKTIITSGDFFTLKKHDQQQTLLRQSADTHDLAVILYTSGTTGFPKGAMLSHYNLISNVVDASHMIQINYRYTFICILPLFHSFAATVCMNFPLLMGAKIVIMKSVKPFRRVVRAIRKNRVRVLVGIPSMYTILANMKMPKIFLGPLIKLFNPVKVCVSGAAALSAKTFNNFEKRFQIPLLEGYGLTEASPVVSINPLKGKRKAGSVGVALSKNIELKIIDEQGNALASGQAGELLVKGPNVMQGYFQKEEATKEVLKDGWLHTGDMAKIDDEGYIYIVGRKKEMVNVRGLNVYPREIEEVLYQNLKIKEAAVIGIVDEHKGEVPKGFVVLQEGQKATEQEILHYLRERLASYKVPKAIEFREALPKNTLGKVLKRILVEEEQSYSKGGTECL